MHALQVATAELDERALGDRTQSPETLVSLLARAKATAIQKKLEPQKAVLVTCDQVVVHKGQIREKPLNEQEVRGSLLLNAGGSDMTAGFSSDSCAWQ